MVVLATKCYVEGDAQKRSLRSLGDQLDNELAELDVEFDIGVRRDEFVSVTLEGDDAPVGRNLLREQWGEITDHFDAGDTYVGTLKSWDEDGFVLDAGQDVRVPTEELGLGPGTPSQLRDRFGLVQHLPMAFVYRGGAATDEANSPHRLADEERDRLYDWTRGDGRVNVNNATRGEVRATVNRAGHARDIITVERLGLLEQSIRCTPDTDPPGLLAAIGEYLPAEIRCVVP